MKYLLLIYQTETENNNANQEAMGVIMNEYWTFTQSIRDSGNYKSGEALQPATTATKVSVRAGKTITTDGPFAETREQLAGYYLIEAESLDEAIGIAARIPGARFAIEIRPVWSMAASA